MLTAKQVGLSAIAVTDHNRPAGAREVARIAKDHDLLVVLASEVSSRVTRSLRMGLTPGTASDLIEGGCVFVGRSSS